MLRNLLTKHPESVGETYWEHFRAATRVSAKCFAASLFQMVHAVLPFVNPPLGTNVESMKDFLEEISPSNRKKKESMK